MFITFFWLFYAVFIGFALSMTWLLIAGLIKVMFGVRLWPFKLTKS